MYTLCGSDRAPLRRWRPTPAAARSRRRRNRTRRAPCRCRPRGRRTSRRASATVRLKRGAGATWRPPSGVGTKRSRATLCGCSCASPKRYTGAKHTSVPASCASHSSRVFVRTAAAMRSFIAGHCDAVVLRGQVVAGEAELLEQLRVEVRLDRRERHVLAVGGLVHGVERRAAVEEVGADVLGVHARPRPCRRTPRRSTPRRRPSRRRRPGPGPSVAPRTARTRRRTRGAGHRRRSRRAPAASAPADRAARRPNRWHR